MCYTYICYYYWLERRSRHRRDEALSPGAGRKWQEAGFGARVAVDGCHHSGETDSTLGGQTWIQQCAQGGKVCRSVDGPGSERLHNRPLPHRGWRKGRSRQVDLRFLTKIGLSSRERTKARTRMSEAAEAASFSIWKMRSQKKSSKAIVWMRTREIRRPLVSMIHRNDRANPMAESCGIVGKYWLPPKWSRIKARGWVLKITTSRLPPHKKCRPQFAYIKYTAWGSHRELSWPL